MAVQDRMLRLLAAWPAGIGGNAAMITAIIAPVVAVMAALAIDTGAIASEQRRLQGLADIAAISAAQDIGNAETAALSTLAINGFAGIDSVSAQSGRITDEIRERMSGRVEVKTGRYRPDPEMRFSRRFVAGASPANAVRVSIQKEQPRYFAVLSDEARKISVTGTAAVTSEAAISVGSRLLSLNDGMLNTLLGELTGSEVDLTVMDYRRLAGADVDLLKTFDALASDLDLEAATYEEVLDSDVALADLASAMAEATDDSAGAKAALASFAGSQGMAEVMVPLKALFELGSAGKAALGTPAKGLDLNIDALQMLSAGAMVSNGANQVDLALDTDVPGVVAVEASLLIGERPQSATWFALSEQSRSIVATSQVRLFVEAKLDGLSLLGDELVRLPLYLELAPAEAGIAGVVCRSGEAKAKRVDVNVRPGIMTLRIADLDGGLQPTSQTQVFEPARILDARLVEVSAAAKASLISGDPSTLHFYTSDIGSGKPKTATTRDALGEVLETAVRDLELEVDVAGLSLVSPRLIQSLVGRVLSEAVEPVDELVFNLTSALGLGLGEADVWVHDAQCNRSMLVQ